MSANHFPERLKFSCIRFLAWLDRVGYESYDPYDIWGTRYGLWSRKVYYAKGRLGIPLVAPLVAGAVGVLELGRLRRAHRLLR